MNTKVKRIAKAVGALIREERERQRFSQEGFADYINLDRSNFGAIERGERNISIHTLARIANGLNVEMVLLFPTIKEIDNLLK